MKSGATEKVKFAKLKRRLGLAHWQVVGVLESVWLFTLRNAPAGDIGKFSDEDIAAGIEWSGDPEEFVTALIECSWLDRCPENRLVVHDWSEHAPNYLKGAMHRHGRGFVHGAKDGAKEGAGQGAKDVHKDHASDALPNQAKSNLTKPILNHAASPPVATKPDDPPKTKTARKDPEGIHADFIRAFEDSWFAKYGVAYPFAGAKDGTAVKYFREQLDEDLESFRRIVREYLSDNSQFVIDSRHSIGLLRSQWVRWSTRPPPGVHANNGGPGLMDQIKASSEAFLRGGTDDAG
jgi:hypothetical protein